MIKCVIVDDEPSAVDILKIYAEKIPYLDVVYTTSNAIEALTYIQSNTVDLLFLDINMPDISGLDLARLTKGKSKIIFTTAYAEFALESYKYEALDYLMKPISFNDFLMASQKMLALANAKAKNVEKTIVVEAKESNEDYIFVKTEHKGKITKILFSDILYIESLKNYVAIYTTEKEQITTLLTMKEMEERLPSNIFFRSHKSFIVSLDKIKALDGNEIILQNVKDRIPLGATYRDALFLILNPKILASKN
jgi:DNA-binding LytR/AlgR family response regulator